MKKLPSCLGGVAAASADGVVADGRVLFSYGIPTKTNPHDIC